MLTAISQADDAFQGAYARAAATIPRFIEYIARGDSIHAAKFKFRDPDESDRLGENRFPFLWLTSTRSHAVNGLFSGTFFEVPAELAKWHQVGQQMDFEPADLFDWMVLRDGHLHGGFTLRAAREKLLETRHASYDRYIGVTVYEPLPT